MSSAQPPQAAANDTAVSGVRQISLDRTRVTSEAPEAAQQEAENALANTLGALTEAEAIPDSDAASLQDASDSVLSPKAAPEPNVATRPQTHVSEDMWLDVTLERDLPATEIDTRQRLAWRFKAAFSAWKMLLPVCSAQTVRGQLVSEMRRYERLLRDSSRNATKQVPKDKQLSDALHMALSDSKVVELERALTELEALLLSADASISQEAFRARWNRDHTDPRQLLRYARFLSARRFGIGYRRDRFEALALELLTQRLPSGRLQLIPRRKAGQVLRQLLRGLYRPQATQGERKEEYREAVAHLRDALDKLDTMTGPKPFFDSELYLDIYGYKISHHDSILCPEFLYLSVAIEVDVHNLLLTWSQVSVSDAGKPISLAALQLQLRAQKEAAQGVFNDFHKPLAGSATPPRAAENVSKRTSESKNAAARSSLAAATARASTPKPEPKRDLGKVARYVGASLFALGALCANLYVTGNLRVREAPQVLSPEVLHSMSSLLVNGRLSADGKRLLGSVSRPTWLKLTPKERSEAAAHIASELQRRGIDHAELLAYRGRAIQIDYGSVVYVDGAK